VRAALLLLVTSFAPDAFHPRPPPVAVGHDLVARRYWEGQTASSGAQDPVGSMLARTPATRMVTLPASTFVMGSTPGDMAIGVAMCRREIRQAECDQVAPFFRSEGVAHEVYVDAFALDRREVTVAEYRRCLAAGACAAPGFEPRDPRFDRDELPVTQVRWGDAAAFCAWRGARLPTEAEWELAAKGAAGSTLPAGANASGGRLFPWGNTYNPRVVNHGSFSRDEEDASDGFAGLAPVGSFPDGATPEGIEDLAGNAQEWVADLYDVDDQGFGYPPGSVVNPRGPSSGVFHVVRGGSYTDGAAWMRTTSRTTTNLARSASIGFRCAMSVGKPR
jgi:formylglycine-generating enzyme required for sulfatase activity